MGRIVGEIGIYEGSVKNSTGLVGSTTDADAANKGAWTGDTEDGDNTMNEINVLVAYFLTTSTIEGAAGHTANRPGADLYEIVPEEVCTDADLNYNDDSSRSTIEVNDPSSRPAISGSMENMEQHDTVFIDYPIWWEETPGIVNTFMESYDFSGKTSVPFCTSGGSSPGPSASNLAELTDGAQRLSGQRLGGGSPQDEVTEWVSGPGLAVSAE